MTNVNHTYSTNFLRHLTATVSLFIICLSAFGQNPYPQYYFMLLNGTDKEAVSCKDSSYKMELIRTEKNKAQRIAGHIRTEQVVFVKDAKPQHLWMVTDNAHDIHFLDYIRLRIIHEQDTQ